MITDQDVEKLKGTFATKEELADVKLELGEVHEAIDEMRENITYLVSTVNTIAGAIQDIREDNAAGAQILARHERQIHALAAHTNATLPE